MTEAHDVALARPWSFSSGRIRRLCQRRCNHRCGPSTIVHVSRRLTIARKEGEQPPTLVNPTVASVSREPRVRAGVLDEALLAGEAVGRDGASGTACKAVTSIERGRAC